MSIRLDPRRLGVLKRLAAEAGVRPGDLVLVWVEERLDAERTGTGVPSGAGAELTERLDELTARIVALESASGRDATQATTEPETGSVEVQAGEDSAPRTTRRRTAVSAAPSGLRAPRAVAKGRGERPECCPARSARITDESKEPPRRWRLSQISKPSNKVELRLSLSTASERCLHGSPKQGRLLSSQFQSPPAVLSERGPMTAAELAGAIVERGRYTPPRSGKPLDAAMVSQRVSNPTYRSRFTRNEGRIGLAG